MSCSGSWTVASDQPLSHSSAQVGVPLGEILGGYRLIRLIGAGSTSHVYFGQHARLGRPAAIKVLHADLVNNPKVVQRMLTEARVVNDIRHPNIVDIIDFVDQPRPRRVALVMEHIAGPSVDSLRGGEPLPWTQAFGIAQQLVDAVEAAHRAGVIHRDLKPDNLLLASDPRPTPDVVPQLKVVDFGIAKVAGPNAGHHQTATQTMLGTPAYMAPEQIAQNPPPSWATDVFAVGEILYELLSGQRAYRSARLSDVVRQKLRGELPDLPLPSMPGRAEIQALIRRCLAFRPDDRPHLSEVVDLIAKVETMPPPRAQDSAGEASASLRAEDILSEATQIAGGSLAGVPEDSDWPPGDAAPPIIDEETVGVVDSETRRDLPVRPRPLDAFEQTEPFSSGVHAAYLPHAAEDSFDDQFATLGQHALNAETARIEPKDGPPAAPPAGRLPLVPARDGGPPVPADDPLAKLSSSTVIRPKPREGSDLTAPDPGPDSAPDFAPDFGPDLGPDGDPVAAQGSDSSADATEDAATKWPEALKRAMNARSNPRSGGMRVAAPNAVPGASLSDALVGAQRSLPDEAVPSVEEAPRVRSSPLRDPLSDLDAAPTDPPPALDDAAAVRGPERAHRASGSAPRAVYGEARVVTRITRPRSYFLLATVPFVLMIAVLLLVARSSPKAPPQRPAIIPIVDPTVDVRSQPPEAFVEDAETGTFLGKTPVAISVSNDGVRRVRVFKAGFAPRVVELTADMPVAYVPLVRE